MTSEIQWHGCRRVHRISPPWPPWRPRLVLQVQVYSVSNSLSCTVRGSLANPLFNSSSPVISRHNILGATTVSRTLFSLSPSVTAPQCILQQLSTPLSASGLHNNMTTAWESEFQTGGVLPGAVDSNSAYFCCKGTVLTTVPLFHAFND